MPNFNLKEPFHSKGDQPSAIEKLSRKVKEGHRYNVLLGVTGSGKTFTMANIIANVDKPSLVLAPNKTLAAQLYNEFKHLFPDNAVEYFVSYYDYYQPEAYIPSSDTYIQKDSSINEMIDKLRHSATMAVLTRQDVIIVASVSCIFGLGDPDDYLAMKVRVESGAELSRDKLLKKLIQMQYERNDMDLHRGVFRVRGDRVEIFPAYEEQRAIRIDFFGDEVDSISEIDPLRGIVLRRLKDISIFPATHYVTRSSTIKRATKTIIAELKKQVDYFRTKDKLIEAQRIEERTNFDLEMIQELGYCNGIENYSRHFTGRAPGDPPPTLLDYFPEDFLLFIDESHIAVPQLRGMYKGDRSRKKTLVEFGFRLPSALDNRPLRFEETESRINQVVFVSATPADYEIDKGKDSISELIVRPTGLLDPFINVRPAKNQVDNLLEEIHKRVKLEERVLVTTLTKRMAEDLCDYYSDLGVRVRYLHADINTLERLEIIMDLRKGEFDVIVGINLLREGLDIPEVSLVAILDADKEGFLRSNRSLIQTCGRAARNVNGMVIMYADVVTKSMHHAINETNRRRKIQETYNEKHNIKPETIQKDITAAFESIEDDSQDQDSVAENIAGYGSDNIDTLENIDVLIEDMEKDMKRAARALEFEKAALLRDQIKAIRKKIVFEL